MTDDNLSRGLDALGAPKLAEEHRQRLAARAGEPPTWPEGIRPTAAQLASYVATYGPTHPAVIEKLTGLLDAADQGTRCHEQDHAGDVSYLTSVLADLSHTRRRAERLEHLEHALAGDAGRYRAAWVSARRRAGREAAHATATADAARRWRAQRDALRLQLEQVGEAATGLVRMIYADTTALRTLRGSVFELPREANAREAARRWWQALRDSRDAARGVVERLDGDPLPETRDGE